jgi:hypothetical protein
MTAPDRDVLHSLIRCNRGILLGATIRIPRFCRLKPGHRGQHETVYLGKLVRFDAPRDAQEAGPKR